MKIEFKRYEGNPIITPTKNWWETKATFNAGAIEFQNKIILLYRAIGDDGISRLGYAETKDGKKIDLRSSSPAVGPNRHDPLEQYGLEDPRITRIGSDYWITCTAASASKENFVSTLVKNLKAEPNYASWRVRAFLLKTKNFKKFQKIGSVFDREDNKDVVIFPEKIKGKYMILDRPLPNITCSWSDKLSGGWSERKMVMSPLGGWQEEKVGVSTVPFKTKKGWLIIYHAADRKKIYRLGLAFLDLNNPAKVIYRHPEPVFAPEKKYELYGQTKNVVFSCGMVEKEDEFYLYYGGADKVIGLATIKKEKLLGVL